MYSFSHPIILFHHIWLKTVWIAYLAICKSAKKLYPMRMYISWLCPCNAWDGLHRHNKVPAQVEVLPIQGTRWKISLYSLHFYLLLTLLSSHYPVFLFRQCKEQNPQFRSFLERHEKQPNTKMMRYGIMPYLLIFLISYNLPMLEWMVFYELLFYFIVLVFCCFLNFFVFCI